jgi:hypothetical protein
MADTSCGPAEVGCARERDSAAVIRTLLSMGWTFARYERWLGDFLERQLFREGGS